MVWHTEQRKINDLVPTAYNPRKLTEKQNADLTASLEKFNLAEIPAINTTGQILAGHQRLRILQLLGRGEEIIDVRVPDRELTKEECDEYLLRSNKNIGEWDWDKIANNFKLEDLKEWGFQDYELSGWLQPSEFSPQNPADLWNGMPEFQNEPRAVKSLIVHFATEEDFRTFTELVKQPISEKARYIWFPANERRDMKAVVYEPAKEQA